MAKCKLYCCIIQCNMVYSGLIDLVKLKCSPFYYGEINMTRYYCLGNIVELTKTVQTLHYG